MPWKIKRTVETDLGDWSFSPGKQSRIPCRVYYEIFNEHIGDKTWPYVVTPYGAWKLGENILPNDSTKMRFVVYEGIGEPNKIDRPKRHKRWVEETKENLVEQNKVPSWVLLRLFGDY